MQKEIGAGNMRGIYLKSISVFPAIQSGKRLSRIKILKVLLLSTQSLSQLGAGEQPSVTFK